MADYERKQGDEVEITATLTKPDSDTAYDLSTADSVRIYMDHPDSETLVVNDTVSFVNDGSDGKVEYTLSEGETSREGFHRIEFVIKYPSSPTQITYPHEGFIILDAEETTDRTLAVADSSDPDASLTTLYADEIAANTGSVVAVKDDLDLQGTEELKNAKLVQTDEILLEDTSS